MTTGHEVLVQPTIYGVPILYGVAIQSPQFTFGVDVTPKIGFYADIASESAPATVAADSYQFWSDS